MGSPVVHFEVMAKDRAKISDFYSKLFDWKMNLMPEMGYAMVDTGADGNGIGGGIGQDDENWVTFYVEVSSAQAALDKAVSLGGKVVRPVVSIPGAVTMAVFSDPEGHVIGVVEPGTPS
jgi:hypothetical protein